MARPAQARILIEMARKILAFHRAMTGRQVSYQLVRNTLVAAQSEDDPVGVDRVNVGSLASFVEAGSTTAYFWVCLQDPLQSRKPPWSPMSGPLLITLSFHSDQPPSRLCIRSSSFRQRGGLQRLSISEKAMPMSHRNFHGHRGLRPCPT